MSDDQFLLPRADQAKLVVILGQIPSLIEDLAVTLTRQSRMGVRVALHARKDAQPLPYDVNASEVTDDLHGTLVAWVRHVCEYRGMAYGGRSGTGGLSRWLATYVEALAMTEGSEEAYDEIRYAFERAREATDCRPEREVQPLTEFEKQGLRNQARDKRVTSMQAEMLMANLGYPALKAATIRKWAERGKVAQGEDGRYSMGELIDIHANRSPRVSA